MKSKAARWPAACPRCADEQVQRARRQLRLDLVALRGRWRQPWQPTFCAARLERELREPRELPRDLA